MGKPGISAELAGILERMAVLYWASEKLRARIRLCTDSFFAARAHPQIDLAPLMVLVIH
jgi:hypothetical protein